MVQIELGQLPYGEAVVAGGLGGLHVAFDEASADFEVVGFFGGRVAEVEGDEVQGGLEAVVDVEVGHAIYHVELEEVGACIGVVDEAGGIEELDVVAGRLEAE